MIGLNKWQPLFTLCGNSDIMTLQGDDETINCVPGDKTTKSDIQHGYNNHAYKFNERHIMVSMPLFTQTVYNYGNICNAKINDSIMYSYVYIILPNVSLLSLVCWYM